MDISALLKLRSAWSTFTANHPRFPGFISAVKNKGIAEGMMIEIAVTYPDGTSMKSGIKVKQSDLELLGTLADIGK